ncbi:MAG: hypothetical protein IJO06_11170 [Thermoguttaceae bacterium]|nr:hypothetical protein [Thermoguttaceae bacterium]
MRHSRNRRRDAATRVLLSAALGFGAAIASPVVFPESPTLRVFAADETREARLSDAELFAVPSEGQGVAFYQERLEAIQARIREIRQTEGKDAAQLAKEKSREARVAVLRVLIDEPSLEAKRLVLLADYLQAKFGESGDLDGFQAFVYANGAALETSVLSSTYIQIAETRNVEAAELFAIGDRVASYSLDQWFSLGPYNRSLEAPSLNYLVEIQDGQTSGYYRRAYLRLRQQRVTIWTYDRLKPIFNLAYRAIFRNLADAADLPESDRAEYFKRYAATLSSDEAKARLADEEAKPENERSDARVAVLKAAVDGALGVEPLAPLFHVKSNANNPKSADDFSETLFDVPDGRSADWYEERLRRLEDSAKNAPPELAPRLIDARHKLLLRLAEAQTTPTTTRFRHFTLLIDSLEEDLDAFQAFAAEFKANADLKDEHEAACVRALDERLIRRRVARAALSPFNPEALSPEKRDAELTEIETELVRLATEEGARLAAGAKESSDLDRIPNVFFQNAPKVAGRLRDKIDAARTAAVAKILPDDSPFATFDETLLEVPNDAPAEFYLKRLTALEKERTRCDVAYREREKERGLDESSRLYVRPGQVRQGGRIVRAKPETVDSRYFATVAELERRLADAPELEPTVCAEHYLRYLAATTDAKPAADYWSPERRRDFYAKRVVEETEKTPLDLRRLVLLNDLIEREEEKIAKDLRTEGYPTPLKADEIARLCDVPSGETAEFYRKRLAALNDVALYAGSNSAFAGNSDSNPNAKFAAQIADAKLDASRRLAFADDAEPFARFVRLQRYADALAADGKVDALRDALETERSRDKKSPVDKLREPFLEFALLKARLQGVKNNPDAVNAPAELTEIADALVERAADGAVPWLFDRAWSQEAETFASEIAKLDADVAKRFIADVCDALADSESAVDRAVAERLNAQFR